MLHKLSLAVDSFVRSGAGRKVVDTSSIVIKGILMIPLEIIDVPDVSVKCGTGA